MQDLRPSSMEMILALAGRSKRPSARRKKGPGSGAGCRALELLAARRQAGQIGI